MQEALSFMYNENPGMGRAAVERTLQSDAQTTAIASKW